MKSKKLITTILAAAMLLGNTAFAADNYATRGEVADMLLMAADDYNPTVERSDIIKGYGGDGELHEDWNINRAEALVMLSRAFGT
ncbi:MAG: peptidase, partial [Clostridia bacterium]|nr:peptidase [Clostridia bacterium]